MSFPWTAELAERILSLRQQYPRWDRDKLVLRRRREECIAYTLMVGASRWISSGAGRFTSHRNQPRYGGAEIAKSPMGHSQA
jgi:hypothetical protein